jgi:three-Cys-motif partner protein
MERTGMAHKTVDEVVRAASRYSFGLCLLDPFAIAPMPFDILRKLIRVKRLDLIVHVSQYDLFRNVRDYANRVGGPLDAFAPGWRDRVSPASSNEVLVREVVQHWRGLVEKEGKTCSEHASLIRGHSNAPYYWLFLVSGHDVAHGFWREVYADPVCRDLFHGM